MAGQHGVLRPAYARGHAEVRSGILLGEDGVLRDLVLDYGDFKLEGALETLDVLEHFELLGRRGQFAIAAERSGAPHAR